MIAYLSLGPPKEARAWKAYPIGSTKSPVSKGLNPEGLVLCFKIVAGFASNFFSSVFYCSLGIFDDYLT